MDRITQNAAAEWSVRARDPRHKPRFEIAVDIDVISKSAGRLSGRTVDLSESGISAILKIEVPVGEIVELEFVLPHGSMKVLSIVRQRNAFRYGFQFLESESERALLHATCRSLDVQQSLRRAATQSDSGK